MSSEVDWKDLYVRTALGETSPNDRQGQLGSPDVIPTGNAPVDWQTLATEQSYNQYYNLPFQAGQPNYVYVRAKNAGAGTNGGQAFLVMSNPAIVLWPGGKGWTQLTTSDGSLYSDLMPAAVPAGKIGVTKDPFMFSPGASDTGHRCLVTWLSTQQHPTPDPPPRIETIDKLAQFLRDHPNYAHHNIDIAANTTGAVTQNQPFSSGTLAATWAFGLQVENAKGFTVSFSCPTPIGGKIVKLAPTTVMQDEKHTITVDDIAVPANLDTSFNYTYETNGLQPKTFSVTFVAFYQPPTTHPLYQRAHTAEQLGVVGAAAGWRGIPVGSIGLMKGGTP